LRRYRKSNRPINPRWATTPARWSKPPDASCSSATWGKLSFLTLRDETGDLQVALDKKRLDETAWQINELLDLGDQITVEGPLGTTKKGEITVWATKLAIASKALLPPPGKWHGLEDVELRYRQRYVDLWANPEVMKLAKIRAQVVGEIRAYLLGLGYSRSRNAMMQISTAARTRAQFVTHHNALDIRSTCASPPSCSSSALLVGGHGQGLRGQPQLPQRRHQPAAQPEFTMLEAYEGLRLPGKPMADMVEGLDLSRRRKSLRHAPYRGTPKRAERSTRRGPWRGCAWWI
jgi:lysyl-tRNA synthetase class 2